MPRYIRRFGRVGMSLGPSEERRFEMWVGYELPPPVRDLSDRGFVAVDDWPDEELERYGVTSFAVVSPSQRDVLARLGIDDVIPHGND